jgi:hypothetical protein
MELIQDVPTKLVRTRVALERYDAAKVKGERMDLSEVFDALREDTGRQFASRDEDVLGFIKNVRASIALLISDERDGRAIERTFLPSLARPVPHLHVVDTWCPVCGTNARGALTKEG